ncbi:MAG: two-component regulator propeller domain-containing protein [Candidatus Omnitrophota bacterium]
MKLFKEIHYILSLKNDCGVNAYSILFSSILLLYPFSNAFSDGQRSLPDPMAFDHLSMEDGLSDYLVSAIVQDDRGFMWFGTDYGLNRFDGYQFTVFRHDPQKPDSLSDNGVVCLYKDSNGVLWIGTKRGLNRYNPLSGGFIHYFHHPNKETTLSDNSITVILEDKNGYLWIGTEYGGLNHFDPQSQSFTHYGSVSSLSSASRENTVTSLCFDSSGELWAGMLKNRGVSRFDPETKTLVRAESPLGIDPFPDIISLLCDRNGFLWFGTWGFGLFRFDPKTGTYEHYLSNPENLIKAEGAGAIVTSLYEDDAGHLWIGTFQQGIRIYHPETGDFQVITSNPGAKGSLSSNSIKTIYIDSAGAFWIGTVDAGLCRYDPNQQRFELIQHNPQNANSLSENRVYALCPDPYGKIWVGTNGGGLDRFDPDTHSFKNYRYDPNASDSLGNDIVISILWDRNGFLWAGNWKGFLNRFDPQTGKFYRFPEDRGCKDGIHVGFFRAFCEDYTGQIWIGTEGDGVCVYDPKTDSFRNYAPNPTDPYSLSGVFVRRIFEDSRRNLWIGTDADGLNRYDREQDRFIVYKNDPQNPASLCNNQVMSIMEDRNGDLWIGTMGGLNRLPSGSMEDFERYTTDDGLPDNRIKGILEDEFGHLWISTNYGISRFDPALDDFRNFDMNDGLQGLSFTPSTCCKGKDGSLYFGGYNGFNRIRPGQIKDNPYIPPIVITSCKVKEESYPLEKKLQEDGQLRLRYNQNFIAFEFAALNFTRSSQNQYAYRMHGIEEDWIFCGTKRIARYTTLAPGDYVFQVKGSNNDGVWNNDGVSIPIRISPPFWATMVFRGWVLAAILLSLAFWHNLRILSVEKQRRELQTEVEKRTAQLLQQSLELEKANEELERLSFLDGLTGIANRRRFEEHYEREWRRSMREYIPISLIMADIDFFKEYNDAFGHQAGDDCLRKIAGAIQRIVKRPGDLAARYGGEEFIIVLVNTDAQSAGFVAEAMRREAETLRIEQKYTETGSFLTISLGAASVIPGVDSSPADLIEEADRALYQAKKEGRNRIIVSDLIQRK